MKWIKKDSSTSHFEDRRGRSPKRGIALGGGITGIIIVAIVSMLLGKEPQGVIETLNTNGWIGGETETEQVDPTRTHENEELKDQTLLVFNNCNHVWEALFQEKGIPSYNAPTLVAFTDAVQSDCGSASSEVGPFYCPGDQKIYIDLNFFIDLSERFSAPGDLAMAYVTAHEFGHHIQNLLGISKKTNLLRHKLSEKEYNKISVQVELNADYLAGVWAFHAQHMGFIEIESGDLEEALTAAEAIGDDTLQKKARGYSVPDSFTHGTSEQRMKAFRQGFQTGQFSGRELQL